MIRFAFLALLALSFACGAPTEEWYPTENIGTLEQPIFMPVAYGWEHGGHQGKCDSSWEGGRCWVPDNTGANVTQRYWFDAASCTAAQGGGVGYFVSHMQAMVAAHVSMLNARGMVGQLATEQPEAGHYFLIKCGAIGGTALGSFAAIENQSHSTANGTLSQYLAGTVKIDDWKIANNSIWWNAPAANRNFFVRNVVNHELLHVAGLGHNVGGTGSAIMDEFFDFNLTKNVWKSQLSASAAEYQAIDCYNATSGTGDRCAD